MIASIYNMGGRKLLEKENEMYAQLVAELKRNLWTGHDAK
jgi:hypothetical protein